jgi:hypothetical protein
MELVHLLCLDMDFGQVRLHATQVHVYRSHNL